MHPLLQKQGYKILLDDERSVQYKAQSLRKECGWWWGPEDEGQSKDSRAKTVQGARQGLQTSFPTSTVGKSSVLLDITPFKVLYIE